MSTTQSVTTNSNNTGEKAMSSGDETSVTKSVVVNVPIAHAFEVFTNRFNLWWPKEHHIGKADLKEAVMETREGGRWYERCVDGTECEWGKVLAWSPPNHVALSWHLNGAFAYDADPNHASRVDVRFTDEGNGKTRVVLEHSHLDRAVEWEKLKQGIAGEGGWSGLLKLFAAKAQELAA